jgi:hypothetical protein
LGVKVETPHLLITSVGADDAADDFLSLFNSNAQFLEASEGKSAYDIGDVERVRLTWSDGTGRLGSPLNAPHSWSWCARILLVQR